MTQTAAQIAAQYSILISDVERVVKTIQSLPYPESFQQTMLELVWQMRATGFGQQAVNRFLSIWESDVIPDFRQSERDDIASMIYLIVYHLGELFRSRGDSPQDTVEGAEYRAGDLHLKLVYYLWENRRVFTVYRQGVCMFNASKHGEDPLIIQQFDSSPEWITTIKDLYKDAVTSG